MSRLPMSFNEARDAITNLVDSKNKFKTNKERTIFLRGLKLGIVSGHALQDEKEVKTFLSAIDLHIEVYAPIKGQSSKNKAQE